MLAAHDWPGNIRELANAIERASILAGNGSIHAEHLPTQFPVRGRTQHSAAAHPPIASPHFTIPEGSPTLRDIEMSYIQAVLEKHNGNNPAASKELGISLKTLYNRSTSFSRAERRERGDPPWGRRRGLGRGQPVGAVSPGDFAFRNC